MNGAATGKAASGKAAPARPSSKPAPKTSSKAQPSSAPRKGEVAPARRKVKPTRAAEVPAGGRDERKKEILRAAVKVFAEKGYHGCRISDVAEEAGVAYGLVYHYFGNKDALLRSIFETNWGVFIKALDFIVASDLGTPEKLRMIIDTLVNAYEASPLIVKVMILEFGRSSRLGDALDTPEMNHVFVALGRMFKDAHERGELREGIDPASAAVLLLGAIESTLASFVVKSAYRGLDLERARQSLHAVFTEGLLAPSVARGAPPSKSAKKA